MRPNFREEVSRLLMDIGTKPRLEDQDPDFPGRVERVLFSVYEDIPELPEGATLHNLFYPFVIEVLYLRTQGESRGVIDHIARDTLGRFSRTDEVPDRRYMLEERLRTLNDSPRLRFTVLTEVGQVCLFNAGLFPDQRRGPGVGYWLHHGRAAYQEAADIANNLPRMEDIAETLGTIGTAFGYYVESLQDIGRSYLWNPNYNLVRQLRTNTAIARHEALKANNTSQAEHLANQIGHLDSILSRHKN